MYQIRQRGVCFLGTLLLVLLCCASTWVAEASAANGPGSNVLNGGIFEGLMTNLSMENHGSMSVASSVYASHNADLAGLYLSSASLSPGFSPNTTSYTASVSSAISSVYIVPTAADNGASITVNGVGVASGSSSQSIYLSQGSNYINILVTAEDGYTQKAYSVVVTRSSSNAYLSSLGISGYSLDQSFYNTRTSYTVTVSSSHITVYAVPEDSSASVSINGQTVSYGHASQSIYLSSGSNQIYITVTSSSGSSMTYYINVYRSGSSEDDDDYYYNGNVSTKSATDVDSNSAILNGSIRSNYYDNYDGYYDYYYDNNISSYGFKYSTDESSWTSITVGNSSYTGSFSHTLTGLRANTYYYYKAFVYGNGGYSYGSTVSFKTKSSSVADAPIITPGGGTYYTSQTVSISNIDTGCVAYYTTDGSNPTTSSTRKKYSSPFTVSSSKTIKAAVYDNNNSTWSSVTSASFTISSNVQNPTVVTPTTTTSFWDVSSGYWAYSTIMSLKNQGYVKGYPDSTFHPDDSISRAEITAIVTNILRIYYYDSNTRHFDDVAPGDWYYAPVEKAYQQGLISVPGSTFGPNRAITREELAEVLVNALGKNNEAQANMYEQTTFNDDARISASKRGYVVTAVKYGLIAGYPGSNNFEPRSGATRAEACVMISNFLRQHL